MSDAQSGRVFSENAWLGPGKFSKRVLISYDKRVRKIEILGDQSEPPADALRVQWLLPGFINAHCHLEYCWLKGKLPRGPVPFGDWMRAIMDTRVNLPDTASRTKAMEHGSQELVAGGCTAVIDSSTDGASATILDRCGIFHFIYHEILGLTTDRAKALWSSANRAISSSENQSRYSLGHGLNPHAPYSVGPWIRQQLVNKHDSELPGHAWHLAETTDENELFLTGTGSIAEYLRELGMPMPFDSVPRKTAAEFLRDEGLLELCETAFHGNVLTDDEAAFFQAPRALVHCPSTHRWFDRTPVPLTKWLHSGVNVCLGTDSLASSETLSMLDIVRIVLEDHLDLTADEVLTMACSNPRKITSLAKSRRFESAGLTAGNCPADFIGMESSVTDDDWRTMLASRETKVKQVWIDGIERL